MPNHFTLNYIFNFILKPSLATLIICNTLGHAATVPVNVGALETVTLQLSWKHQFEFAGFYAVIHKGLYAKIWYSSKIRHWFSSI